MFQYQAEINQKRVARGRELIESHVDFGKMQDTELDELQSAAADTIADILHALNAAGVFVGELEHDGALGFLERAHRSYVGDFEDEE